MIIIQRMDADISDRKIVQKLDKINAQITKKLGGKIDGPYFPQDAALMYIFHVDRYEWLSEAGRIWMEMVADEKIGVTPLRYEIAVTPKEFFGK
jgi:hypothetical protein